MDMRHWVSPGLQGDRKPVPLVFPFPCQQTSGVNKNQGGQRDFNLNRSISSRVSLTKPTVAAKGFQLSRSGDCIPFLTETGISARGRSTHFPRTVAARLFLPCVNKRRVHFGTRKTLGALRQAMFSTLILKIREPGRKVRLQLEQSKTTQAALSKPIQYPWRRDTAERGGHHGALDGVRLNNIKAT